MTDLAYHAALIGPEVEEFAQTDDGCRLWTVSSGTSSASSAAASATWAETAAGTAVRRARHARPAAPEHPGLQPPRPARRGFLLCHGGPGFWDTLAPIAAEIHAARPDGGEVVRWDQRGGGRSAHRGPYTVERVVRDMEAVRKHYGLDEVTIVGHSWGATLGLRYAMAYPARVRQLVYIAGAGLSWNWYEEFAARHKQAMSEVADRMAQIRSQAGPSREDEREADALRLSIEFTDRSRARSHAIEQVTPYFDSDPQAAAALRDEWRSWDEQEQIQRCRALRTPTLIIDGALDLRPRWAVDSLAAALPDVVRVTLERSGHFPWIDEPEAFASVLRDHLR